MPVQRKQQDYYSEGRRILHSKTGLWGFQGRGIKKIGKKEMRFVGEQWLERTTIKP